MQIKHICYFCKETGVFPLNDPYLPESNVTCPYCGGIGYYTTDIIGNDFTNTLDKIQELKTKIN